MQTIDSELDKKIEFYENQIEEIKQKKLENEKKIGGFQIYLDQINELYETYGITEEELLIFRADEIESWILRMDKEDEQPALYTNLLKHFKRVVNSRKRKPQTAKKKVTARKG